MNKLVCLALGSKYDKIAIKRAIKLAPFYERRFLVLYFLKSKKNGLINFFNNKSDKKQIKQIKHYKELCEETDQCENIYAKTDIFKGSIKDLINYLEDSDTKLVIICDKSIEDETDSYKYNEDAYNIAKNVYCPVICVRSE